MIRSALFILGALGVGLPSGAAAVELALPLGARLTAERISELDGFNAPIAAFNGTDVPTVEVEGRITRRAWRIGSPGLTPLQVIMPLRAQLEDLGYTLTFECGAALCGGFDFRFSTEVLPGPNMYVDITDFRYLTALRGDPTAPTQAVGVLTSVTAQSAYVQIISADTQLSSGDAIATELPTALPEAKAPGPLLDSFGDRLLADGKVVMADLQFAPGTSDLGPGPFASLTQLAAVLKADTSIRIALVGHTDATGSLRANMAVSKARAESVRRRLQDGYGIAATRIDADGIGYLSPVAPNWTESGRSQNRRVEAVLLRTE